MSLLCESEALPFDAARPESQMQASQPPLDNMNNPESSPLLTKQNSIFSLTLDEIQVKSGKNFGSMSMDEFLANLWTVEETQVPHNKPFEDNKTVEIRHSALARQSSLSIPVPLCKKTVDEVWFEIQKGVQREEDVIRPSGNNYEDLDEAIQRQQTLGEITLEDFLVKAGVVQDSSKVTTLQNISTSSSSPVGHALGIELYGQNPNGVVGDSLSTMIYPVFGHSKIIIGESSSNVLETERSSRCLPDFDAFRIKKRIIDGPPEVLLERRQRRMIKNRESAARSRARKQAYTVELELELNHLTEENMKLKQIVEENEKKIKQEVMNRKQQIITEKKAEKLRRIRRIVSVGW